MAVSGVALSSIAPQALAGPATTGSVATQKPAGSLPSVGAQGGSVQAQQMAGVRAQLSIPQGVASRRIAGGATTFHGNQGLTAGQYRFVFQGNGDAVVYGNGRALWVVRTYGRAAGGRMVMQRDGNLVIYNRSGRPVWSTQTNGKAAGGRLVLQSDGNLVIYAKNGRAAWSNRRAGANTLTPGAVLGPGHYIQAHGNRARLIMHGNGTLEQVSASGKSMWKRKFPAGSSLTMWKDGSLAAKAPNGARVWRAPGAGTYRPRTVMQSNDLLVTYSGSRTKVVTPIKSVSANASAHVSALYRQVNADRAKHGLPALRWNSNLAKAARAHTNRMARANRLSHRLPGEPSLGKRIAATGYTFAYAGENVGMNPNTSVGGALQLESIMYHQKPPNDGHRKNILSRRFTQIGIDVRVVNGKLWMTQNFGRPR